MKKVSLGSFFGLNHFLEVEDSDNEPWAERFKKYLKLQENYAVKKYRDSLFLEELLK